MVGFYTDCLLNSSIILWRSTSIDFLGWSREHFVLKIPPHKKITQGVKSDDRGGHPRHGAKLSHDDSLRTLGVKAISHFNKAMCWSAVLYPPKTPEHSFPINTGCWNEWQVVGKQIHSAFEDMQGRPHFGQKSKVPKSRHSRKVLPRQWAFHENSSVQS